MKPIEKIDFENVFVITRKIRNLLLLPEKNFSFEKNQFRASKDLRVFIFTIQLKFRNS